MKNILLISLIGSAILILSFQNKFEGGKSQNDLENSNYKGKVKVCTSYYYDLTKTGISFPEKWTYKSTTEFNKAGNILSLIYFNEARSDKPVHQMNYTYDQYQRKIKTSHSDGSIINRSNYTYNSKQNLVETVFSKDVISFLFIYNHFGKRYHV